MQYLMRNFIGLRKKYLIVLMHYLIAIIGYRSVNYVYLFFNPKIDEIIYEHKSIREEKDVDVLVENIRKAKDSNGNRYETFNYWGLVKYSFFVEDFSPEIRFIAISTSGYMSFSLSGYAIMTWKTVELDDQGNVLDVDYMRKVF